MLCGGRVFFQEPANSPVKAANSFPGSTPAQAQPDIFMLFLHFLRRLKDYGALLQFAGYRGLRSGAKP
jgi:hypothetical protein